MTTTSLTTTSSGIIVSAGHTLDVLNGGIALSLTVDRGGQVVVSSGGKTSVTALNSGAAETVRAGGSAKSTTVASGATLTVSSGGSATQTTVANGGIETVSAGGAASATTVLSGGTEKVSSGGSESGGSIASGGHEVLTVGGVLSGVTLAAGAVLTEVGMTIGSGQTMTLAPIGAAVTGFSVGAGGTTSDVVTARQTEVASGGTLAVAAGGLAISTTVDSGGTETVALSGIADKTLVLAGGSESVASGGREVGGVVASGGSETFVVGGHLSNLTLSAGAVLTEVGMTVGSGKTMTLAPITTKLTGLWIGDDGTTAHVVSAISAKVASGGTLSVSSGGAAISTTVSGGVETVASGGVTSNTLVTGGGRLVLNAGATATGAIAFGGTGDTLTISGTTAPAATISGFTSGDTIDLRGFTTGATIGSSGDTLIVTQGGATLDLHFAAGSTLPTLKLPDGGGGLELVVCFCAGTGIRTPAGDVPVETLRPGDTVLLAAGGSAPVRWLGRQTVARHFADPLTDHPVRIRAGAIAEGLPTRDLLLSPSHAILLDCALVQAGALVNGTSIMRVPATELPETFAYYHVELEQHALLLAEGVPAESFVDHVERVAFDNWADHEAMFGDCPPIEELPLPRAKASRQIAEATRRRLAARSRAIMPEIEADAA